MEQGINKTNRLVSAYMRGLMEERGVTQSDIAKAINRKAQSYVSDRLSNKKSWLIDDLDVIAPMLGLPDALSLMAAATGASRRSDYEADEARIMAAVNAKIDAGGLGLAADHDPDKEASKGVDSEFA